MKTLLAGNPKAGQKGGLLSTPLFHVTGCHSELILDSVLDGVLSLRQRSFNGTDADCVEF